MLALIEGSADAILRTCFPVLSFPARLFPCVLVLKFISSFKGLVLQTHSIITVLALVNTVSVSDSGNFIDQMINQFGMSELPPILRPRVISFIPTETTIPYGYLIPHLLHLCCIARQFASCAVDISPLCFVSDGTQARLFVADGIAKLTFCGSGTQSSVFSHFGVLSDINHSQED